MRLLWITLTVVSCLGLGRLAEGQHVCAYANDNVISNAVDGYLFSNTSVTYIEPVVTGGQGSSTSFFATPFIAIAPHTNHLYVSNSGSSDIAFFTIDPASCHVTKVANYPSGGGNFAGMGIAISPNGKFLYASNTQPATISVLKINSDGSLSSPVQIVPLPELLVSMAISPDGKTLVTSQSGELQVMAYTIDSASGELQFASGVHTTGAAAGLTIDAQSKFMYVGTGSNNGLEVQVIAIGAGAQLTYVADDFFGAGTSGNCVLLSRDGKFLYVSNQISATVTTLNVNPGTGALSFNATSSDGISFVDEPSLLATTPTGTLVFTGDFNTNGTPALGILRASSNGKLTSLGKFPLARNSGPTSIAAGVFK
ncbi:MAG: beta-propeller fold lactonase family protein [Acidobacteriales bacterium]|nr:beta-propeller fold lactonase family protein [Terriglobales bacterium]